MAERGRSDQITVFFSGAPTEVSDQVGNKAGRKPFIRGKLGENVQRINFKSIAKIGLGIRGARMYNEALGAYSNNRIRQRRVQTTMLFSQYAIGVAKFGPFGLAYAATDLGYRSIMHSIEVDKQNREANMLREKSGNIARKNSRYDGEKL